MRMRQLAEGAEALHQSGKLHRDIKPTNVLVTPEGRVVLLDFGLTADLESSGRHRTKDRQIVGTVAHMSPEQAAGLSITAASDWYSVGVILYEALTGRLPFAGPPQDLILAKQTTAPINPSELVNGLPDDLVRLCVELLDRNSSARPTGRHIIALLTGLAPGSADAPEPSRPLPLIGRARHLQILDSVYAALLGKGRTQSIFVFGRTGTGKTTLIRSFLEGLSSQEDAVVLWGRCYERESVPYKALDNLFDALARYLKGLSPRRVQALLPTDVAHLARVFPVMQGVPAVAAARRNAADLPDPQEVRRRAFAALRELFNRLARKVPLVLAVNDLQWGDVDSAILLSDLLGSPQSPVLLFLGSFRSEDADDSPFLAELRRSIESRPAGLEHRELAVEALTQSEARELALALLGRDDPVARAQAHVVARESGGNPLFIDELVKHIQGGGPIDHWEAIGRLDLDEVLWERIRRQPEERAAAPGHRRRLRPADPPGPGLPGRRAGRRRAGGAGLAPHGAADTAYRPARPGRDRDLSRPDPRDRDGPPAGGADALASRAAGAGDVGRRPVRPGAIGRALSRGGRRGAGQRLLRARGRSGRGGAGVRPCGAALQDGAGAARGLGRAGPAAAEEAGRRPGQRRAGRRGGAVLPERGHLGPVGRDPRAEAAGFDSAPDQRAHRRGAGALRTLLDPLGIRMPETPGRAMLSLLWHRAILRVRGLRFSPRAEAQVPPLNRTRIDLCWSAVAGLSMYEPIRGADFQTRGLLLALAAGEPFRVARALAMEAGHRAVHGLPAAKEVAALLETAGDVAATIESPHARGMVELVRGISALLVGRWKASHAALEQAECLFRDHCTGVTWERDTGQNFALWSLFQMGQVGELRRRWTALFREAQERGDLYATSNLTAFYATISRLAGDELPESEAELEAFLAARDGRTLNLQHTAAFDSLTHIDLYRGDVTRAWVRLDAIWPDYERAMLLRIQLIRIQMLEIRARTAVAAAERSQLPDPLLVQAERDARQLEREGQEWGVAHAQAHLRAAVAACRDDAVRAAEELAVAADLYDRADMALSAQLMRYRIGEIQTDETARELRAGPISGSRNRGLPTPLAGPGWWRRGSPGSAPRRPRRATEASPRPSPTGEYLADAPRDDFVVARLHHPDTDLQRVARERADLDGGLALAELLHHLRRGKPARPMIPADAQVRHGVGDRGDDNLGPHVREFLEGRGDPAAAVLPLLPDCGMILLQVGFQCHEQADHLFLVDLVGPADRVGIGAVVELRGLDQVLAAEEQTRRLRAASPFPPRTPPGRIPAW